MGRVFTYEQIETGMVPSEESFLNAKAMFGLEVALATAGGNLHAGILFGSVAVSQQTQRSDFDCLLVTTEADTAMQTAQSIVRSISRATQNQIEIGAIAYPKQVLATGRHEIDRFFGQHLTGPQRRVYGEDITDYITFDNQPALNVFNNYLRNKKRRLSGAFLSQQPQDTYLGIQRMLESPLAIGRKLVRVLDELEDTQLGTNQSATKHIVRDQALGVYETLEVDQGARSIVEADAQYSALLSATLAGGIDQPTYDAHIEELAAKLPAAVEWLDSVDRAVPSYLRGKPIY